MQGWMSVWVLWCAVQTGSDWCCSDWVRLVLFTALFRLGQTGAVHSAVQTGSDWVRLTLTAPLPPHHAQNSLTHILLESHQRDTKSHRIYWEYFVSITWIWKVTSKWSNQVNGTLNVVGQSFHILLVVYSVTMAVFYKLCVLCIKS